MQAYGALDKPVVVNWWHHFTCDVTVTSFYKGLTPNCNTTFTIYPGICVPLFVLLRLRVAEILRGRKWGQQIPPPPSGWRVARRSSGRTGQGYVIYFGYFGRAMSYSWCNIRDLIKVCQHAQIWSKLRPLRSKFGSIQFWIVSPQFAQLNSHDGYRLVFFATLAWYTVSF